MADDETGFHWPKEIVKDKTTITLYQPQYDFFKNNMLEGRMALSVKVKDKETVFGALWFKARLATDLEERTAVIENQLEKTDHDHLGKLITYLSNLEAKIAIWITSAPRPEHTTAIIWLNEISPPDTSFYLVKVEAYTIGDSEPAPLFSTISGPSPEAKEIGEQKQDLAERHLMRIEFWKQLLDKARAITPLHANVSPSKDNWVTAGAGKSGMGWSYSITMNKGSVELFIDRGPDKKEETDEIYEIVCKDRERIENAFGEALEWDKKEGRRVCRIKSHCIIGGLNDTDSWAEIQDDMIDKMKRLEEALRPSLGKI